jgi:hypothetical protein
MIVWDEARNENGETTTQFEDLLGKTIFEIDGLEVDSEEVVFKTADGCYFKLYHEIDCSENVAIEDINGNVERLIGSPILVADESSNSDNPPDDEFGTFTWTFYRLATSKGWVVIRWLGKSNGHYSERASFVQGFERVEARG